MTYDCTLATKDGEIVRNHPGPNPHGFSQIASSTRARQGRKLPEWLTSAYVKVLILCILENSIHQDIHFNQVQ